MSPIVQNDSEPSITRIVVIRHGDFVTGEGVGDPGLSPRGKTQCALLRRRLLESGELSDATMLLSSPLKRARETAELIVDAIGMGACSVMEFPLLREMYWGVAEGLTWSQLVDKHGAPNGPEAPFAPGGESWKEFVTRAADALGHVAQQFSGSTIVIVAHTGIIEASFVQFAGLAKREERFAMAPRNTGLTCWVSLASAVPKEWRLEVYNDASHLWAAGVFAHRNEDYARLVDGEDPFWRAVGRDIGGGPTRKTQTR